MISLITREHTRCPKCGAEHAKLRLHWEAIPLPWKLLGAGVLVLAWNFLPAVVRIGLPACMIAVGAGMLIAAWQHRRRAEEGEVPHA